MVANTRGTGEAVTEASALVSMPSEVQLRCLSLRQVQAIDDALLGIGDYGEVRLVKNKGKLRFIQTLSSRAIEGNEPSLVQDCS
jgi:hypothetical protein